MYAIVEIAGQQFKVEKEQEIFVHRLEGDTGSSIEFDQVLLLDNSGKVTVGTPLVNGALIKAKILEHMKGDKVTVFHKKRRKGYQKENGHRQYLSKVVIEDILIGAKKAAKKEEPKAETAPKEKVAPKAKAEAKPEVKEVKKAAPKKATEKKEAAPKAEKKTAPKAEKKEAAPKAEKKAAAPKAEKKAAAPKAEKKAKPENKEDGDSGK